MDSPVYELRDSVLSLVRQKVRLASSTCNFVLGQYTIQCGNK
jgi:hypothetical protein